MSANAFARLVRAAPALVCATLAFAPAEAQLQSGTSPTGASGSPKPDTPVTPEAPKALIQQVVIQGTQRIEPGTVMSYISIRQGDPYDDQAIDRALKALFATGLFADVKFNWNGSTLTINVVENPIINQIAFEGQSKVSEKDLTKEVQLKPRTVFTRAKVQSDVQRIIELYRRNGKFGATVDPQIIQRPQNRVDLIFSINEGPTTGVATINFIGNKVFDDDTLRSQIATETSAWWKILASNDNYDPDRLTFDKEQLRRYYLSHGYADFHVVSAVAELAPDHDNFYMTFTIDEGQLYHYGKIKIESDIKDLGPAQLRPLVKITDGEVFDASLIEKAIDTLTNAAGTKGYAFAEVHPREARDREKRTIDIIFKIEQGPRVYVEKINITGNTRTLDKVIRRQMRLEEGDAFNRVLVDRSRTRIRGLGFFKDVDIKQTQGSAPDKAVLNVAVTEQSTGELSLGAGYSSTSSFVGEFSYTERNLFGRGQYLRASIQASYISKQFQLSFTEPYFLDRPLSAGVDLYKVFNNFDQADYQGDTTAAGFRLGFPTSEFGSVGLRYTIRFDRVTPYAGAPTQIQQAAGSYSSSVIGYSYLYNTLDDPIRPHRGLTFAFSQDFSGLGGYEKYLRTETSFSMYHPVIWDDFVGSFTASAGYITGYAGQDVRINERFFKGGDSFRGFKLAGIGPRDTVIQGTGGAVGGNIYAIGTIQFRIPDFLPADYGVGTSLFSDFGTLGKVDGDRSTLCPTATKNISCIRDDLAFRASAGVSVSWKSPFGPVQISLGIPLVKSKYDKTEFIHFNAGTGL
ncbi:MAG TPA: outer membrane protein assembly factor BamA [Rhizomicrobium sp.]|nr:outer membrane protein assembly factor BamA [Rhizomicrobium sp.]